MAITRRGKPIFWNPFIFVPWDVLFGAEASSSSLPLGEEESHIRLEVMRKNRGDRIDVHLKRDEKKALPSTASCEKNGGNCSVPFTLSYSRPRICPSSKTARRSADGFGYGTKPDQQCVFYDLQQYYRVLKQRNNLLKEIKVKPALADTLFVWDEQLIERGERIMAVRAKFLARLDEIATQRHEILTGGKDCLKTEYKPNCEGGSLREKLERSLDRDIYTGSTNAGPHKDDILFLVNGKDVKQFGSQGQQRTTALSARLAEIELIREETGESPVLLLDDVLSELDGKRQKYLMESIEGLQAFLTCTGIEDAVRSYLSRENLFYVKNGKIGKK